MPNTPNFPQAVGSSEIPEAALRCRRRIDEIIIHCSATRAGRPFTAADIRRWHLQRGFRDIGYHFVVRLDGTVEAGRNLDAIGAHCLNHNRRSIGICYIGGLDADGRPSDTRTAPQRRALFTLISRLKAIYPAATIHGHCEFAAKTCPCFDVNEYRSQFPGTQLIVPRPPE